MDELRPLDEELRLDDEPRPLRNDELLRLDDLLRPLDVLRPLEELRPSCWDELRPLLLLFSWPRPLDELRSLLDDDDDRR